MTDSKNPKISDGFDAFFQNFINSQEFNSLKNISEKSYSENSFEYTLRSIEKEISKNENILASFEKNFSEKNSEHPKKITKNSENSEKNPTIEVHHFEKKAGKPFGFEAVAGMESLKKELSESFIKPLKFKFLIEKLR